jgi:hypothetical protein
MPKKRQSSAPRFSDIASMLFVGVLLVGFIIWFVFWAGETEPPDVTVDVAPPANNTPYVGKKW